MVLIFIFLSLYIISLKNTFLFDSNYKTSNKLKNNNLINKKKYLTECKLLNEKIDRKVIDSERQCYYSCAEDDIGRVDTSIGYPCQPFILEER